MTGFATGAISGGNQTTLRGGYNLQRYAVLDVPTVALSFQPDADQTSAQSAVITYASASSGSYTNVRQGMVILITPSSDYVSDWNNKPNECFFGYVRTTPSASLTLDIGLTAFQWTTSSYVNVLTTFYPQVKPYIIDSATLIQYKDYSLSYRLPLPRIENLQSAYVVVTNTSTTVSLAPTVTSESGGSISTYLWKALRSNVSLSSTSASSITVTVDSGEMDWVYLKVTDSNGISNWFATFIAGVSKSHNAPAFVDVLTSDITHSLESGVSASFITRGAISTVMNRARCAVYSVIEYADGTKTPLINNIDFVGHIQAINVSTRGDETGVTQEASFEAEGLSRIAERLNVPDLPIRKGSNNTWDYLNTLSVWTALWHVMSEHTQYANLSAIARLSNSTDFSSVAINTPKEPLASVFKTLGGRANIEPNYAKSGETAFQRNASILETTTLRNALTTIATLNTLDVQSLSVENDAVISTGNITMGALYYNGDSDTERYLKIIAPKIAVEGALENTQDGQILTANATDADALTEAGARGGNLWALANRVTFVALEGVQLGAYRDYPPTNYQWWKLSYPTTENNRGIVLDTNTRFLLVETTERYDVERGINSATWRFQKETSSDDYGQEAQFLALDSFYNYPLQPFTPPYFDLELDPPLPLNPNNPNEGTGIIDDESPDKTERNKPAPKGCERLTMTSKGDVVTMNGSTVSGAIYTIEVQGYFKENDNWCKTWDFSATDGGWETLYAFAGGVGVSGAWTGDSWKSVYNAIGDFSYMAFDISFPSTATVTDALLDSLATGNRGGSNNGEIDLYTSAPPYSGSDVTKITTAQVNENNAFARKISTWTGSEAGINYARVYASCEGNSGTTYTQIFRVTLKGTGTNPFGANNCKPNSQVLKDAFYKEWVTGVATALGATEGLQIDKGSGFSAVTSLPPYSPSHSYSFQETGDGDQWSFKFGDADYTDNELGYFTVTICGEGLNV